MINLILRDPLHIRVETDNSNYLKRMKKYFTYKVPNYFWKSKFRSGVWDGTTCLVKSNNILPFGLLFDFIKFHKTEFIDLSLNVDDEVKKLFKQEKKIDIKFDLKYYPRDYQEDCIRACLKYTKCIIVSATSSGKSLQITYLLKILKDNNLVNRQLIIVPTTSLISQFYDDMIDYGIDKKLLGKVYSKEKDFEKDYVISTWQTLANNLDKLKLYDTVVTDETHKAKAHVLAKIIKKCPAKYRFGFTGTLPAETLDVLNIKSYLGPVAKTYASGDLADMGYISHCNVNMIYINYFRDFNSYRYDDLKDILFLNEYRLSVIRDILKQVRENFLLLVGKIEKEGEILKEYLGKNFPRREVVFLSGRDKIEYREYWRKEMQKRKDIILIAMYQIYQEGINIPSLKYLIFAAPFKSKIRVIQSVGRTTRKFQNKITGSEVFDIVDNTKYFRDQGTKRYKHYQKEKFNVREININENQEISKDLFDEGVFK